MDIKNLFKKKVEPLNLEKIYSEHKYEFELLLIKDFVGYIPKDVNEPVLKMFKEYGEIFEKWTLYQSWYINTRAMNDVVKIPFYNGMMVYLKVLNTMAKIHKKNFQPPQSKDNGEVGVAASVIETSLEDLKFFKDNVNKTKSAEGNQDTEDKGVVKS